MGKSNPNFFELTIKYCPESPNDYTQYFIKTKRIKNTKHLMVEYNNGNIILSDIIWCEEYDVSSDKHVYKSLIPFVTTELNGNIFRCRLNNFKRVGVIKSK